MKAPHEYGDELVSIIKADFNATFRSLFRAFEAERDDEIFRVRTRMPHPFANLALVNRIPTPALLREALEGLCEETFPSCFMSTEPVPSESLRILEESGFGLVEAMPLMSLDLDRLEVPPVPDGCTLDRAGPEQHEAWVDAMAGGYELPRELVDPMGPGSMFEQSHDCAIEFHVVHHEGRPVASSMHTVRDGVVGIYCIATHPDLRGRGLGAWVTAAPLRGFHDAGHRTAVLQASEMGAPVYRRLGFSEHGTIALHVRVPD